MDLSREQREAIATTLGMTDVLAELDLWHAEVGGRNAFAASWQRLLDAEASSNEDFRALASAWAAKDRVADWFAKTLSGYRANGTDFAYGQDIRNLVDSVRFSHSHLSRFLQLADVYTWFLQFRNRNRGSDDRRHRSVLDIFGRGGVDLFPDKYKVWPK